jgi:hypothetical protein
MYVSSAKQVYEERHKQPFEYLAAWHILRDKVKWIAKLKTSTKPGEKRKATDGVERPAGRKTAKDDTAEKRKQQQQQRSKNSEAANDDRFVAASEKKAHMLEQLFQYNIFAHDPQSTESQAYFKMQREKLWKAMRAAEETLQVVNQQHDDDEDMRGSNQMNADDADVPLAQADELENESWEVV